MARVLLCAALTSALAACASATPPASEPTAPPPPPTGCHAILELLDDAGPPPSGAELKSALGRRADSLAEVEVTPELVDDTQAYVVALRELLARDPAPAIAEFSQHMSEVTSDCHADRCAELIQLIGAHTMHQPDLESSLGKLADELEAFDHADDEQQQVLNDLARDARAASQSMRALRESSLRVRLAVERLRERCSAGPSK
ncbi:MAG: hypothetical protein KF718_02520 [Polyangiaceae bacterium]|nr:hypothetical protein [Polyangiaceae bacterium]